MKFFYAIVIILCVVCAIQAETVWSENFSTFDNWRSVRKYEKDEFKVENNELVVTCAHNPYKGDYYQCEIPFIEKGELTFEVNINSSASNNYRHLSLQIKLYSMLTAFNGYGGSKWQRFDGKNWKNAGTIKNGEWAKCKISFDNSLIEFFINDMENPVLVDSGLKLTPDKDGKAYIGIGNYGLAGATIVNKIRNMSLSKGKSGNQAVAIQPKTAMIFSGIAAEEYRINEILDYLGISRFEKYNLQTLLNIYTQNRFSLDKLPSLKRSNLSEIIILADMPLTNGCMPDYVQEMIVENVEKGGKLLILGGMFTLNKGDFGGTALEKLVPGELGSPWEISRLASPRAAGDAGNVQFLHTLKKHADTSVLAKAGDRDFIVSKNFGQGKVIACLGIPCGSFPDPFWQARQWPKYISQFINGGINL